MPPFLSFFLAEFMTAAWFFAFGAATGSFLNVVIYRVPIGMTLLGQSLCPHCRSRIAMRDNIPIVSWIRLRGRCRHCGGPISHRYWVIELLVGLIFVSVALIVIAGGGRTLPVRAAHNWGFAFNLYSFRPDLTTWAAMYTIALTTLLTLSMIERDGNRLPRRIPLLAIIGLLALASYFPNIAQNDPAYPGQHESAEKAWLYALLSTAAGGLFGWAIAPDGKDSGRDRRSKDFSVAAWSIVGAAFGIVPVLAIAILCGPQTTRWRTFAVFIGSAVHLFAWRWISLAMHWGNVERPVYLFVLGLVIAVITLRWARSILRTQEPNAMA